MEEAEISALSSMIDFLAPCCCLISFQSRGESTGVLRAEAVPYGVASARAEPRAELLAAADQQVAGWLQGSVAMPRWRSGQDPVMSREMADPKAFIAMVDCRKPIAELLQLTARLCHLVRHLGHRRCLRDGQSTHLRHLFEEAPHRSGGRQSSDWALCLQLQRLKQRKAELKVLSLLAAWPCL